MVADDVYRSRLQAAIAEVRSWLLQIGGHGHVEQTEGHDFWKLSVTPLVAGPAQFEIVLRTDQRYDISVAGETYEDLPVPSLDLFLPLVTAIARGRIVQRWTETKETGAPVSVETRIALPSDQTWSRSRALGEVSSNAIGDLLVRDRHFLPYLR